MSPGDPLLPPGFLKTLFFTDLDGGVPDNPELPTEARQVRYWEDMLSTCSALVERYAPSAPDAIKRQAVLRTAGYLNEHTWSAMSQTGDGGKLVSFATGPLSALRHSGGMALLSAFKRRRAL